MCPKVSVCVPTYNRREYLRQTLDSIFKQTYKDYEIVVVDDGSTDQTDAMVKSLGRDVRYYWQPNAGDAAAKNKAIGQARAPYVTIIDSDDLLVDDAVERMMAVMERQAGEVIAYGPYVRIDEHGRPSGRSKRKLRSGYITKYLFQEMLVQSCGSLFPKRVIEEAGKFDTSLPVCSDIDLWLRLSLKYRFIALDEPTFLRRRHSSNLSRTSAANIITELEVLERFYYHDGGASVVPRQTAMRRFSEEQRRVAQYALSQGDFALAADFFRRSLAHRFNAKALLGMLRARFIARQRQ